MITSPVFRQAAEEEGLEIDWELVKRLAREPRLEGKSGHQRRRVDSMHTVRSKL